MMNTQEQMEVYGWAKSVKRFWFTILNLVAYVFTAAADHAMLIAERAIALAAPAPNAISVFNIAQSELGYNWIAAGLMAVVIELIGFYLIHKALSLLEPMLLEVNRQTVTKFALATVALLVGVGIVIMFVRHMEQIGDGHMVMAWWPVLTLCVFTVQALHEWEQTSKRKRLTPPRSGSQPQHTAPYSGAEAVDAVDAVDAVGVQGLTTEQLQWLRDNPKTKAKAIADHLGISKSTATRRLQPYIDEGIVIAEQVGQSYLYSLAPGFELPILPADDNPHVNGHVPALV